MWFLRGGKPVVGAVEMSESRGDSQGQWNKGGGKGGKPVFGLPPLPSDRHFHGAPGIECQKPDSCAASPDAAQQSLLGLLHGNSGIRIGVFQRDAFQFGQAHTGSQEALAVRYLSEYLQRCSTLPINPPSFAVGLFDNLGNGARPVEVYIRIQVLAIEPVDRLGVERRDVAEAHVFADNGSVLRFHQSVVSGAMRTLKRTSPLPARNARF